MDDKQAPIYETKIIPRKERITNAIGLPLLMLWAAGVILFALDKFQTDKGAGIFVAVCLIIWAVWLGWKTLTTKEITTVIPAPPSPEQIKAQQEADAKLYAFLNKWWVRYPLGACLLIGSVYLYDANPKRWLLSVILALFGLLAIRELVLVGAVIGVGWLLIQGIASLPVSIAIIIGAIIIASAINDKG